LKASDPQALAAVALPGDAPVVTICGAGKISLIAAQAKQYAIVCFAHVTNQMAQQGDDFEKGPDQGSQAALQVIDHTARQLHYRV
jgi:hypothetical protein